jgi:hypothetical protein
MLPNDFRDRSARLVDVAFTERWRQLPQALASIDAKCATAGAYQSSSRFLMIHRAIAQELEVRAILIWKNLVRAHQAAGAPVSEGTPIDYIPHSRESECAYPQREMSGRPAGVVPPVAFPPEKRKGGFSFAPKNNQRGNRVTRSPSVVAL